jgi:hypothetical protein
MVCKELSMNRMNSIQLFLSLTFLLIGVNAQALDRIAKIYAIGDEGGSPLFIQKTKLVTDADGVTRVSTTIEDSKGKLAMTEKCSFKGHTLIFDELEQLQTGEAYTMEVVKDEVVFKLFKIVDGKRVPDGDPRKEDMTDNFITGPLSEPYLRDNWAELMSGDTVRVRFGVAERGDSVGFKFYRNKDTDTKDGKAVGLKMRPAGFLGLFFKPIDLLLDNETKLLKRYEGRTPLKRKDGTKWEPLDAVILYDTLPESV